jgi:hypothetical protein
LNGKKGVTFDCLLLDIHDVDGQPAHVFVVLVVLLLRYWMMTVVLSVVDAGLSTLGLLLFQARKNQKKPKNFVVVVVVEYIKPFQSYYYPRYVSLTARG